VPETEAERIEKYRFERLRFSAQATSVVAGRLANSVNATASGDTHSSGEAVPEW